MEPTDAAEVPWPSLGLPPVGGIAAGLGIFVLLIAPLLILKFHSGKFPIDLAVYREAGRVVLHGGDPYGPSFGSTLRVPLSFTYPPFAALASVPLALFPPAVLGVAWTAMSLSLLVAMVWLAAQPALRSAVRRGISLRWVALAPLMGLAAGALAWTVPLSQTIALGQINVPLALGCLVDCTWTSKRRGLLVGLATAIKLTPGVFILYFAVTRQWAAAVRAAVTAAVCELLALALLPRPSGEYWLHLVLSPRRTGNVGYFTNQSLFGLFSRLHLALWLWPAAALGAAGLGLWRAARAHRAGQELAAVALVGLAGLAISPVSWQHHAVWIVLVLGVLAAWATTVPLSPARTAGALGVLVLFLVPFPLLGHLLPWEGSAAVVARVLENSYVLAYVALLLVLPISREGVSAAVSAGPGAQLETAQR